MASGDIVPALNLSDALVHVTDSTQYPLSQRTHEQRRTDDSFFVGCERLPNCVLTPIARKALTSWIWGHG